MSTKQILHKKVKEAYDEAGIEYFPSAYDRNEARFYKLAGKRKITGTINQLFRVRNQDGKEFFYYQEMLKSTDYRANDIEFPAVVGKYEMPVFRKEYDPETEVIKAVEVTRHDTIYEFPFKRETLDTLAEKINEQTSFVIVGSGRRYSGFTFEDIRERSFAELLEYGRTGAWPKPQGQIAK